MNIITKAYLVQHVLRWRLTWDRRNTRRAYRVPGNPRFMSAIESAGLINDGDLVGFAGLAGNQRPSLIYWAIRELFEATGHPRDLSILAVGGIGGRSKIPGTLEELGLAGLTKRLISGHIETFKSFMRLADQGKLEIQCLPQGTLALLIDAQTRGEQSILLPTGKGTFMDPRVGRGSPLSGADAEQWVTPEGENLRYRLPKIDIAVFNAPAADRHGNIYVKNCAMISESREMALAAKRNGGKVIANVGRVVPEGCDAIFLPADKVDAIVVWRGTEQTASVPHRRYWPMFTTESDIPVDEAVARTKTVSDLLGITPRRTAPDYAMARLTARVFAAHGNKGTYVNIGVGLPEEVCRVMSEGGLLDDISLLTESGVIGGIPTPGVFFGAAACPTRMMSSPEVFKLCYRELDCTVLGLLQVDSQGNVNVSRRGEGAINYVGPGGFIDLTTAARMVIFIGTWMANAQFAVEQGQMRLIKPGNPKFVHKVDEITFSGPEAIKAGKKVFYITNVGAFRLTERGVELFTVMPGVDIQRDILDASPMKIVLPESGDVPIAEPAIVTGNGFKLTLDAKP